jgi:septal ring factor EnvC (AmiA/AmiB activator)
MPTLLIATLALPLAMLSLARQDGAQASPARIAQLESQLDKLNQQSDQLVEQYLQAKLTLTQTERTLSALRHDADQAQQTLRDAQQRLGARRATTWPRCSIPPIPATPSTASRCWTCSPGRTAT